MLRDREWRKSQQTIGGYRAVEHRDNQNKGFIGLQPEHEAALVGYKGEIWEYSDTEYACIIRSSIVANRFAKLIGSKIRVRTGDEGVYRFPKNMLLDALEAIKMPKSYATRVRLANKAGKSK